MIKFLKSFKNFRFKGTAILFLVFIALLAFVLIFEKKKPTKTDEDLGNKKEMFTVWEFKAEEAQKINIDFKDKNFEIVKEGDKWLVKKPKEFEAKKEKIDEILKDLEKIEGEKKITPEKLSDFGLDKPQLKAKATLKDGKQYEILLGDENPENTKIYAKRADENYVFLVEQSLKGTLQVKEEDLEKK